MRSCRLVGGSLAGFLLVSGGSVAAEWRAERVLGEAGFQHAGDVSEIVPLEDGKRAFTASGDGTARLWDLESGRELKRFSRDDSGTVWGVRPLPGGKEILTAGSGGKVTRWDLKTGEKLRTYEHEGTAFRLALRPGGKEFVAVDNSNFAVLWDLESGEKLRTFKGHTDGVYSAVFVSGGDRLITGGSDGKLKVWDVESGKCKRTLKEDFEEIYTLALSPDKTRLAFCTDDERVCVYEAETLKLVWTEKDAGEMKVVAWSPDGTKLAGANNDEELVVWDGESGKELHKISLPGDSHRGVAFSSDGRELYSGGDRLLFRYDLATGQRLAPAGGIPNLQDGIGQVAVSSDGGVVFASADGELLEAWETRSGEAKVQFEGPDEPESLALSPDGTLLALGGSGGEVWLLDSASGKQVRKLASGNAGRGGRNGFRGRVNRVVFDEEGGRLVAASSGHSAPLWDVKTGNELELFSGHEDSVTDVVFASGETVITASDDKSLRLWEVRGGKEINRIKLPDRSPESLVSLEGGRSLLTSTHDEHLYGFLSAPEQEVAPLSAPEVRKLVDLLGAEKFADRRAASLELIAQGPRVLSLLEAVHPDDPEVVFRLREVRAEVRKAEVGSELALLHTFKESVYAMAAHAEGRQWAVITGSGASSRIVIGEVKDEALRIVQEFSDGHGPVTLAFSRDGKALVAGNRDGTVSVFRRQDQGAGPGGKEKRAPRGAL